MAMASVAAGLLLLLVMQHTAGDQPDECSLEPDPGSCLAYVLQIFYNNTSGQCEWFVWGGCQGNKNRFASLSTCRGTCDDSGSGNGCLIPMPAATVGSRTAGCLVPMPNKANAL